VPSGRYKYRLPIVSAGGKMPAEWILMLVCRGASKCSNNFDACEPWPLPSFFLPALLPCVEAACGSGCVPPGLYRSVARNRVLIRHGRAGGLGCYSGALCVLIPCLKSGRRCAPCGFDMLHSKNVPTEFGETNGFVSSVYLRCGAGAGLGLNTVLCGKIYL